MKHTINVESGKLFVLKDGKWVEIAPEDQGDIKELMMYERVGGPVCDVPFKLLFKSGIYTIEAEGRFESVKQFKYHGGNWLDWREGYNHEHEIIDTRNVAYWIPDEGKKLSQERINEIQEGIDFIRGKEPSQESPDKDWTDLLADIYNCLDPRSTQYKTESYKQKWIITRKT